MSDAMDLEKKAQVLQAAEKINSTSLSEKKVFGAEIMAEPESNPVDHLISDVLASEGLAVEDPSESSEVWL